MENKTEVMFFSLSKRERRLFSTVNNSIYRETVRYNPNRHVKYEKLQKNQVILSKAQTILLNQ